MFQFEIGRSRFPTGTRFSTTALVILIAIAPILIISFLGHEYRGVLSRFITPTQFTNYDTLRFMIPSALGDSWLPMKQALASLQAGDDNVYQTLFFGKGVRFQYPATSLLAFEYRYLFGSFSVTQLNAFNLLVYSLNACSAGVLAWLLYRPSPAFQSRHDMPARSLNVYPIGIAALAVVAAYLFYPFERAQVLGQIQIWIDGLVTVALVFWLCDRRFIAGVCIGLACAIKPQLALLLLWGLLWREAGFCLGILIVFVPITGFAIQHYGLHNNLGYLDVLAFLSRHGEAYFANNSVNGILNTYFLRDSLLWDSTTLTPYTPIVFAGTLAASVVSLCLIAVPPLLWRHRGPGILDLAAALILTVVGSPVAWEHHYGILFPLYFVALRWISGVPARSTRALLFGLLILSWLLVANFIPFTFLFANTPFRAVQAHIFFGAILLLALLFKLASRFATFSAPVTRFTAVPQAVGTVTDNSSREVDLLVL
jgi:alpha-1,2-mannosyltransferase